MMPSRLELKIPPPLVLLTSAGLHTFLVSWFPTIGIEMPLILSFACVLLALFFGFSGVFLCWRKKTTIHPWDPTDTTALVTDGVFAVSRNPMYFGLLLLLSGWVLQPLHPASLLALMIFFLYINRFQIAPEERILAAKFGDHYSAYCDRVRRWI